VIELAMREELDAFIGADWGECRGAMVEHAKCGRAKTGYGVNYAWILYTPLFSIIVLFIPALTLSSAG
jgi:hypothetical protein